MWPVWVGHLGENETGKKTAGEVHNTTITGWLFGLCVVFFWGGVGGGDDKTLAVFWGCFYWRGKG